MTAKAYFVLYANCIPVKGATRSVICDLQLNRYQPIPNSLYEVLTDHAGKTIEATKQYYEYQHDEVIDEYFEFLIEEEYGFVTNKADWFDPIEVTWDAPGLVTNMIVDCIHLWDHDWQILLPQIEKLGTPDLQIRHYGPGSIEDLRGFLQLTATSRIKSIEIIIGAHASLTTEALTSLQSFGRLRSLTVHSSPADEVVYLGNTGFGNIYRVRQKIDGPHHCGIIQPLYFMVNMESFMEARTHNSCLNRKLSIDASGDICNCPSMPDRYGNIKDTKLQTALKSPGFTDTWGIIKDKISTCKDCEFRYICSDCRAYTEEDQRYGKPAKCSYNPYTGCYDDEIEKASP